MIEHQFNVPQAIWLEGVLRMNLFNSSQFAFLQAKMAESSFCLMAGVFYEQVDWSELNKLLRRLSSFTLVTKSGLLLRRMSSDFHQFFLVVGSLTHRVRRGLAAHLEKL